MRRIRTAVTRSLFFSQCFCILFSSHFRLLCHVVVRHGANAHMKSGLTAVNFKYAKSV